MPYTRSRKKSPESDRSRNKEGLSADILICLRAILYEIKALRRDISTLTLSKPPKVLSRALADRIYGAPEPVRFGTTD